VPGVVGPQQRRTMPSPRRSRGRVRPRSGPTPA